MSGAEQSLPARWNNSVPASGQGSPDDGLGQQDGVAQQDGFGQKTGHDGEAAHAAHDLVGPVVANGRGEEAVTLPAEASDPVVSAEPVTSGDAQGVATDPTAPAPTPRRGRLGLGRGRGSRGGRGSFARELPVL
ncbi:hypothetical protein, partial [Frankia sp. Cr1]|uniref:hypothetical protein n=1 Tax=Frankia sp. Cr1 TaxID=3073931 RepID=UPI002AD5B328